MSLSSEDLAFASRNLHLLGAAEKEQVLRLIEEREKLAAREAARDHFMPFVKAVWPDFIGGAHHEIMAEAFEEVSAGTTKRLILDMPPRFTKSEFGSWLLPAWFLGKFPKKKIIQVSNNDDLASGFGRRVRNMIDGASLMTAEGTVPPVSYADIFPKVKLAEDSKAAGLWHTNWGGEYFSVGVKGKVTGRGADVAIVDDPHSEQEAKQAESNPAVFDDVYSWYTSGIRQRLQPGGSIIIIVTRWSKRDLVGQVLRQMQKDKAAGLTKDEYDDWKVISLPAILDEDQPTERSMWPGFWPLKELKRTKNALPVAKWQAQYQQNPTSETAAIFKRTSWRAWGKDTDIDQAAGRSSCPSPVHRRSWNELIPPACKFTLHSWDAAATKNDRSHPSAFTSWGVFEVEDPITGRVIDNLILLSSMKRRMEFPELKKTAKEYYDDDQPDEVLIENKSAGMQLIQEFRSMGMPVQDFSGSSRGTRAAPNDKIARANLVSDIFASGYVWAPDTRFAESVIEQMADFPNGDEDDLVDSTVQAMIRFRQGGFIRTANDEAEDEDTQRPRRKRMY